MVREGGERMVREEGENGEGGGREKNGEGGGREW